MFLKNEYKKYTVPSISSDELDDIVNYNSVRRKDSELIFTNTLFGLLSFFNHDKKRNVFTDFIQSDLVFLYAENTILKGEELLIDYALFTYEESMRKFKLDRFGIKEKEDKPRDFQPASTTQKK